MTITVRGIVFAAVAATMASGFAASADAASSLGNGGTVAQRFGYANPPTLLRPQFVPVRRDRVVSVCPKIC